MDNWYSIEPFGELELMLKLLGNEEKNGEIYFDIRDECGVIYGYVYDSNKRIFKPDCTDLRYNCFAYNSPKDLLDIHGFFEYCVY